MGIEACAHNLNLRRVTYLFYLLVVLEAVLGKKNGVIMGETAGACYAADGSALIGQGDGLW
jgi:hypothetical protein